MPQDATTTRANMANRTKNPSQAVAVPAGSSQGLTVQFNLVFQRTFNAEDIFDALVAQYGSGKVVSDRDDMGHNVYQLRILP